MSFQHDMKINIKQIILLGVSIFLFFLLCFNYRYNCFHFVDHDWFNHWQEDSEWLVQQRMIDDEKFGFRYHYGLLGEYPTVDPPYSYHPDHSNYNGQIGIQGFAFGLVYRIFHSIGAAYWVEVILFVAVSFALLYWLYTEFGIISAIGAYYVLFFSRWLIVSARNLYWVIWTLILPFVLMLYILRAEEKKRNLKKPIAFLLLFLSIFIRSGCGYEFISVAMINMVVPVIYYAVKNKWSLKETIIRIVKYGIAALAGFFAAILVCLTQVYFYNDRSWKAAVDTLLNRIAYRTGVGAAGKDFGQLVTDSLHASKYSVLKSYFTAGEPIIFTWRMDLIVLVIIIAIALTFISRNFITEIDDRRNSLIALDAMILVSFLGPLSWYVLASGHSYIHTHICYLLWSLPFLMLGSALFFYVFAYLLKHLYKTYLTRSLVISMVSFAIIAYLYIDNYSYPVHQIKEAVSNGQLIYSGDDTNIYLYQDKLYYLFDKIYYDNSRYFLHYYTEDEEANDFAYSGFVNQDFNFKDARQPLPFWSRKKVAIRSVPNNFMITDIETGRYNLDDDVRYWETKVNIEETEDDITSFDVTALTDDNWTNGCNNNDNILLVQSDDLSFEYLVGKELHFNNGINATVTDVQRKDSYYHIFTDKHLSLSDDNLTCQVSK